MIAPVRGVPYPVPLIADLQIHEVLYEYDGGALVFSATALGGVLMLGFLLGHEVVQTAPTVRSSSRYLLVPTDTATVDALRRNDLALRDALTGQHLMLAVDLEGQECLIRGAIRLTVPPGDDVLPAVGMGLYGPVRRRVAGSRGQTN